MILLDTTILVYAVTRGDPFHEPCRALLESIEDGSVRAQTTVEVIQEFAHVRTRFTDRSRAVRDATEYAAVLEPLVRPTPEDLHFGLHLFAGISNLGAFDAVLAAAALGRDLPLASADRGFREVAGLESLDPAEKDFLDLARALS